MASTDRLLLNSLKEVERYQGRKHEAIHHLRAVWCYSSDVISSLKGYLNLAKARLTLGENLSSSQYRPEHQASFYVVDDPDEGFKAQPSANLDAHKDQQLRHRKKTAKVPGKAFVPETMYWFSSLPNRDLRRAQDRFARGISL